MNWQTRIQQPAYTSPSGVRTTFDVEDVSTQVDKRTAAFNFPDADGTYVQDLGHTGRRYPLRFFFWGDDHDLQADAFLTSLLERGNGRLEHPVYGVVVVVPFGRIGRRDDLKTAANQSVYEVEFWETIETLYPVGTLDAGASVVGAVGEFNDAIASEFGDGLDLATATEKATVKATYTRFLDDATAGLAAVAAVQDNVEQQFQTIEASIDRGIDVLIDEPLNLAFQTALLIEAPARAAALISDRLAAYGDLASALIAGDGANVTDNNQLRTVDLYASTYTAGSVLSVVNNRFDTKPQALEAATDVLDQFDELTTWRDAAFDGVSEIDTGSAYQQLQEAVALAAGFLVEISFTLKQERTITLDRARTLIDLEAELYGTTGENLDFLISSNDLSGDEHLELPEGRTVVYYV